MQAHLPCETPSRRRPDAQPRTRATIGALVALSFLLVTETGHSYCRTTTCDPKTEDCSPPSGETCTQKGSSLYWPVRCVGYSLQRDAAPGIAFDAFRDVSKRSFDKWQTVACADGSAPSVELFYLGPITCGTIEYNTPRGGNANIIVFRPQSWPYRDVAHTLALTTVSFNKVTGEIYDVDLELNAVGSRITVTDDDVGYDLESILTHEFGHFLGLAHSDDASATMYVQYKAGSTEMRSLEADDMAGICAIYPKGRVAGACDPTPRHGYQDNCGQRPEDEGGCCSTAPSRSSSSQTRALGAALLAMVILYVRSRARR